MVKKENCCQNFLSAFLVFVGVTCGWSVPSFCHVHHVKLVHGDRGGSGTPSSQRLSAEGTVAGVATGILCPLFGHLQPCV